MSRRARLSTHSPMAFFAVGLAVAVLVAAALPTGAVPTDSGESITTGDSGLDGPSRDDSALRRIDRHAFPFGTDLSFEGDLVVAGSANWDGPADSGIRLFRRQDDGTLSPLSFLPCPAWHADVDFLPDTPDDAEHPSARPRYVALSHDDGAANECEPGDGQAGISIIDVRNPRRPEPISFVDTIHGSHNLTTVGDTGLVYVSSYALDDPLAEAGVSIVDVGANPEDPPVTFLEFPRAQSAAERDETRYTMRNDTDKVPESPGCHDIGLDLDQDLAFCAGITETHIWDISDPRDPVIIEIIHNPLINVDHAAQVNADGDVLVVNDEWAGAAGGPTGCLTARPPTGALWFYDISDPTDAEPRGYWSPPEPDPVGDFTCTSHFFGTFETDAGGDRLVASWYDHGIWVVDFDTPELATGVAAFQPEGETFWSAYPYKGTLYANSFAPVTLTGSDDDPGAGGLWALELDGYSHDDPAPPSRR